MGYQTHFYTYVKFLCKLCSLILLDIPQVYSEDAEKLELVLFLSKIYKIYFCTQK